MNFINKKTLAALIAVSGTVLAFSQGCTVETAPPAPVNNDAYFDMTNDTYDSVDVLIGGVLADSLAPGETHSYDLGLPGTYNIQVGKTGDTTGELNNINQFFGTGVTTWSVYDNAPVITVTNNFPIDAIDLTVDSLSYKFAVSNGSNWNVAFDSTLNPGETGFLLVDTNQVHTVDFYDFTTGILMKEVSDTFFDGDHLSYSFP